MVRQRNHLASVLGEAAPSVPLKKISSEGTALRLLRPDRTGRSASAYFSPTLESAGPHTINSEVFFWPPGSHSRSIGRLSQLTCKGVVGKSRVVGKRMCSMAPTWSCVGGWTLGEDFS